jgi:glycosyltransferase involved in cell wall biosynthesis
MVEVLLIIIFSGFGIYVIFILLMLAAWINEKKFIPSASADTFVSVIIALRNEGHNLPALITDLISQDYPKEYYEIILVDDHSDDNTFVLLKEFEAKYSQIKACSLSSSLEGKKAALRYGMECTQGKFVMTTDADCRIPPKWISTTVSFYHCKKASLIIGPVLYLNGNRIFEHIQALEFASLIATGAATAALKMPILCNAANLAFEKSIYPSDENALHSQFPSGDDIFFLLHQKKIGRLRIFFLKSPAALVLTSPVRTLKEFFGQRIRWFSKSSYYRDPEIITGGIIIVIVNFCLLLACIPAIVDYHFWPLLPCLFFVKLITDLSLMGSFLIFFNRIQLLWYSPILEIVYPFYMFLIIFKSKTGRYQWKKRIVHAG